MVEWLNNKGLMSAWGPTAACLGQLLVVDAGIIISEMQRAQRVEMLQVNPLVTPLSTSHFQMRLSSALQDKSCAP